MQPHIAQHQVWNSIKELLHRHDCVIVPNFGGFVCNREHTRIDQISHLITPPAKRIVFNQNLKTNDGLLAQTVSQALAISYSEALRSIDELVNQLRSHLEEIKQLDIDSFGSFRLNADANYVFLPDKLNTYLYASFGLMPLQVVPVSGLKGASRQTRIFKDRKDIREVRNLARAKNIGLKILTGALAVMLFLNGYIFLTDANLVGGARISTTGFNSWFDSLMHSGKSETKAIQPATDSLTEEVIPPSPVNENKADTQIEAQPLPELIEEQSQAIVENMHLLNLAEVFASSNKSNPASDWLQPADNITAPIAEMAAETPTPEQPVEEVHPATGKATYTYHVIGGVFCKEKNARKFYDKLREKGFTAELLLNKRINCNRVSYRKLYSLEEAIQLMDSLKTSQENTEAWVLTIKE
jgi:hypothetical protein